MRTGWNLAASRRRRIPTKSDKVRRVTPDSLHEDDRERLVRFQRNKSHQQLVRGVAVLTSGDIKERLELKLYAGFYFE